MCKKMGRHLTEDYYTLEKNKEKKAEYIKKRKTQSVDKENQPPRRSNRYKKRG